MSPLDEELTTFFGDYARTFHLDLDRFCDLFHLPSTTVRLDGTVQLFRSKEDVAQFFTGAKQRYEAEGCTQWAIRRLDAVSLGAGNAAATIDWEMVRADGSAIRGWRQTYNVITTAQGWRVLLSTLHRGSET